MDEGGGLLGRLHLDGPLLAGTAVLVAIGLGALYSAGGGTEALVLKQAMRMGVGLTGMVLLARCSPQTLARVSPWLYAAGLLLLVLTEFFGSGRGAQRWLEVGPVRFQPAEVMKVAVPLVCARLFASGPLPPSRARLACAGILVAVPVVLVARQPDLGTAALVVASGCFVIFLAGIEVRCLLGLALLLLLSLVPLWFSMHDYQRQRILTLLDPQRDPLGSGYHIIQSVIAVGSGGLFGKGWMNGTQSRLEFLPEHHTDFIFALLCEEFGMVGAVGLVAAYLVVIVRGLQIAYGAQDSFGRLAAGGLSLALFSYVFVNMGMVIGQLPVVGVPLPLISYGGSALVTVLAALGILMSIKTHRKRLSF